MLFFFLNKSYINKKKITRKLKPKWKGIYNGILYPLPKSYKGINKFRRGIRKFRNQSPLNMKMQIKINPHSTAISPMAMKVIVWHY